MNNGFDLERTNIDKTNIYWYEIIFLIISYDKNNTNKRISNR